MNQPLTTISSPAPPAVPNRAEHKRFSENHYNRAQTLAAWLLATLVAVNTSAGVAVMAAAEGAARQPAIAFAVGVGLAVCSGLCSWGEALNYAGYHWAESQEKLSDEEVSMRDRSYKVAPKMATAAFGLNVFSLAAFALGCWWAAAVM